MSVVSFVIPAAMPLFSKPITLDVVRCVRHFENPGVWVVELADGIVTCLSSSDYDAERGAFVVGKKESLGGVPVLQLYEFPVELHETDRSIRVAQKWGQIQKWEELTAELTRWVRCGRCREFWGLTRCQARKCAGPWL